jgi:hypothetical protein
MPIRHAALNGDFLFARSERHPVHLAGASRNRRRRCVIIPPWHEIYQRDHDDGCHNCGQDAAHQLNNTAGRRRAQRPLTSKRRSRIYFFSGNRWSSDVSHVSMLLTILIAALISLASRARSGRRRKRVARDISSGLSRRKRVEDGDDSRRGEGHGKHDAD